MTIIEIIIFIILIFFSALFSSAEIAFFTLTSAKVKTLLNSKKKNAKLIWLLLKKPQRLLITILIGNNIANVLTASLATALTTQYFGSVGIGIATGIVTAAILIFGEITPKSIAQKNSVLIAQKTAKMFYFLDIIFTPIIWLLSKWNSLIIKKFVKKTDVPQVSETEIKALTRLGVESGIIDYQEHELITNVFEFNDVKAKEIMTPRYKIIALNGEVPVEQIAYFVSQSGFSRYPVYIDDEDNIIGYIHVNDIMKVLNSDDREDILKKIARPVMYVRGNDKIEPLFRLMLKKREHLSLVIKPNKPSQIIGLITLEDILEELVGEIEDETDKSKTAKRKYKN